MTFQYESAQGAILRTISPRKCEDIRQYLLTALPAKWTFGELQDALLAYQWEGRRLLINHLAPIFIWVARHNRIWDENEENP